MTQTDAILKAWLTQAIATGGPFDPAALFLGMATAVTDKGGATALGDVTEATGAMATRVAISAWGTPQKMLDGRWCVDAAAKVFKPASSGEAQTLTHAFLVSASTAGTLKAFKALTSPKELVDETRALTYVWRLTIDPNGNFDANVYWNG